MEQRVADIEGTLSKIASQMGDMAKQVDRVINHTDTNRRGREDAIANVLKELQTEVAKLSVKADGPRASDPVPAWLKVIGALGTAVILVFTIGNVLINYGSADASIVARIQAVETTVQTSARLRDQQQEGFRDRLRSLEQSDQVGAERIGTVLQSLATITAQLQAQTVRMEEVLRRQDRLESRLGARPGAMEPPEQPTVFPHPL